MRWLLLESDVAAPGDQVVHNLISQVLHDLEPLEWIPAVQKLHLHLKLWQFVIELKLEVDFVSVVVHVDEAVVQEESGIALLAVAVVDGCASWDVLARLDDEALLLVAIVPGCLPWPLVIKHVSVGDKSIRFDAIDSNAENSTCRDHSHLGVLVKRELRKVWNLRADQIVVFLDFFNFLVDLIDKSAAFEP